MPQSVKIDLLVYAANAGGVAAAVAGRRAGLEVLVVEPSNHVGGMTSGGLGWTDHGDTSTVVGLAREFYAAITDHYEKIGDPDALAIHDDWYFEPHVAEQCLRSMLGDVSVTFGHRVSHVERSGSRITAVTFDAAPPEADGAPAAQAAEPGALVVKPTFVIDASYESDLTHLAGCKTISRRESVQEHGEPVAGIGPERFEDFDGNVRPHDLIGDVRLTLDPYLTPGRPDSGLLPLIEPGPMGEPGTASDVIQAFNFRPCLVRDADHQQPLAAPSDYDSQRYELMGRIVLGLEKAGRPLRGEQLVHRPGTKTHLLKFSVLPGNKCDLNNSGPFSTDLAGDPRNGSNAYVHGTWADRQRCWRAHRDHILGLLHFMGTDDRVPCDARAEVCRWRLPTDEFTDTGGWPHQLYVREARRLVGRACVTQHDCEAGENSPLAKDAVCWGSYPLDSHVCRRLAVDGEVVAEGGFMRRVNTKYPLPFDAMVPAEPGPTNLLVTFGLSATHAAYAGLRMEPVFMMASQAAGNAAAAAIRNAP